MNCISLFTDRARETPSLAAIWMRDKGVISYQELADLAARAQRICRRAGVGAGDTVLLFDMPSPRLYAYITGILALGGSILLVEPWMAATHIQKVVSDLKPKLFVGNRLAQAWGVRFPSVRAIPHWVHADRAKSEIGGVPHVESVDANLAGTLTFTSGTTGAPKAIIRTQGRLVEQLRAVSRALVRDGERGADLCVFPAVTLANLAIGRPTVLVPWPWALGAFRGVDNLPLHLQPVTAACGPTVLEKLVRSTELKHLRTVRVGGAVADNSVFERGFAKWPEASWEHVYGSSEAEPVAHTDAREAVRKSTARGLLQNLFVGHPIPELRTRLEDGVLWVAGAHVSPGYAGADARQEALKKRDEDGNSWHNMGDRILEDEDGWWYQGRAGQTKGDFAFEQRLYSFLGYSTCFLHRGDSQLPYVVGEGVARRRGEIMARFPDVGGVIEAKIVRDRRHRARMDRVQTVARVAGHVPSVKV